MLALGFVALATAGCPLPGPADAGASPADAGAEFKDAGTTHADAGTAPADAGTAPADAGTGVPAGLSFAKQILTTAFFAEGASFGDFNNDGITDVVAGPFIYAGPDFTQARAYRAVAEVSPYNYSDNFFAFPYDFDDDGWLDVLVIAFPGFDASVFLNSGETEGDFARHIVFDTVDNEAPGFTDIVGSAHPELVCGNEGRLGYATWDPQAPTEPWTWHPISPDLGFGQYTHGLGTGDVNGDGRRDILERNGVWYQPQDLSGDPEWARNETTLGLGGGQMEVFDVDGDGDGDIITTLHAHGTGLAWFEQRPGGVFVEHLISGATATDGETSAVLNEPHSLTLADFDGDGLLDIVTGDRFWGHVPDDPVFEAESNLYWFQLVRTETGAAYLAHHIDDQSGVGTQVVAGDINGDGRPDIVVSNKKGAFVFRQSADDEGE